MVGPPANVQDVADTLTEVYPSVDVSDRVRALEKAIEGDYDHMLTQLAEIVDSINRSKTPGYPLSLKYKDIDAMLPHQWRELLMPTAHRLVQWAGFTPGTIDREQWDSYQIRDWKVDPRLLVMMGLVDPAKISIKQEPNRLQKIRENRPRAIFQVSSVDRLAMQWLSGPQNKTEIAQWASLPSKPGLGFAPSAAPALKKGIRKLGSNTSYADVGAWDATVHGWELTADSRRRIRLSHTQDTPFANALMTMAVVLQNTVYIDSSGNLWAQTNPGMQISGGYNTSSGNSYMRLLVCALVGAYPAIAMGDDTVEQTIDDAHAKYAALGHALKDYAKADSTMVEFCSKIFPMAPGRETESWPADISKLVFRLLQNDPDTGLFHQFLQDTYCSPDLVEALDVLSAVSWLSAL